MDFENFLNDYLSVGQYVYFQHDILSIKIKAIFLISFITLIIVVGIIAKLTIGKVVETHKNNNDWTIIFISIALNIVLSGYVLLFIANQINFWENRVVSKNEFYEFIFFKNPNDIEKIEKCFNFNEKIFAKELKECYNKKSNQNQTVK